jgi:hypothetical protein
MELDKVNENLGDNRDGRVPTIFLARSTRKVLIYHLNPADDYKLTDWSVEHMMRDGYSCIGCLCGGKIYIIPDRLTNKKNVEKMLDLWQSAYERELGTARIAAANTDMWDGRGNNDCGGGN